ncbi:hypothetical protein IJJ37_00210 [Candidatus Saccharibacteria bacterium]|nr:hypothetical protein [Candidatus Saccharibacteria bacterium]
MAREIAILKRAKISKAQQYMLLAVLGAALVLGASLAVTLHAVNQISFNSNVIAAEEQAIVTYSNAVKNIGICKKPAGEVYNLDEIKACNPNSVSISSVSGTLRYNIMENLAASEVLNSVPKENTQDCMNPKTNKNYTYDEMNEIYAEADTDEEMAAASELIQSCSALRIIPDALPAFKNEEALLSSLNKIFLLSGWEPESLSPTGTSTASTLGNNLNTFSVRLSVEADSATTLTVLDNIERSIREFNIERATIGWGGNNTLVLQAQASAFYMTPTTLSETTKTVKVGGK